MSHSNILPFAAADFADRETRRMRFNQVKTIFTAILESAASAIHEMNVNQEFKQFNRLSEATGRADKAMKELEQQVIGSKFLYEELLALTLTQLEMMLGDVNQLVVDHKLAHPDTQVDLDDGRQVSMIDPQSTPVIKESPMTTASTIISPTTGVSSAVQQAVLARLQKPVANCYKRELFQKLFNSDDVLFAPYKREWNNTTGYFDGIVEDKSAITGPIGTVVKFITENRRAALVIKSRWGNLVIFERYSDGENNTFACNGPTELTQLFELTDGGINDLKMSLVFGQGYSAGRDNCVINMEKMFDPAFLAEEEFAD